jgi:Bacterial membrane protein YfhO
MKKILTNALPLLFLVAAVIVFSNEVFWGQVPFFRDLGTYMYPLRYSLAQSLNSGHLPLWERHIAMGFPLLANPQTATFYPPHLIFLFLPFFSAVGALLVFHYLVAAIGSFLLFRWWNYAASLALTGAILFTFGGVIVSLVNLQDHFQSAVWLPWLILAGEQCFKSQRWGAFIAFTFVSTVQFLAGSPEMYAMSMALLIVATINNVDGVSYSWRTWMKSIGLVVGANVIVVALSMVQLLPTIELFFQSRRPDGLVFQEAAMWSLNPFALLNFFWLDKEVDMNRFTGLHVFFDRDPPFLITYYVGAIALFGLCAWFFYSSRKERTLLLSVIAATLIVAFGSYTPVYYYLFHYVPLFRIVRFPEKYLFLTYSFLIFVVLRGINSFVQDKSEKKKGPLLVFGSVLLVQLIAYLFCRFGMDDLVVWLHAAVTDIEGRGKFFVSLPGILASLEREILLSAALMAAFLLYRLGKIRVALLQGVIVVLVLIDLTAAHRPYQYMLKPDFTASKSKLLPPPGDEHYRVFIGLPYLHPSRYTFKLQPFPGVIAAQWAALYPNSGVLDGFEYVQEIDTFGRLPYSHFLNYARNLPPEKMYPFLGALNVKYVTTFNALPEGAITSLGFRAEYPLWLYRLETTVSRVYFARNVVVEKDIDNALHRMTASDFDAFKTVIVDQAPANTVAESGNATAEIRRYENEVVDIDAALDAPRILVLTDSFDPGWRVYVDGKEEKIFRANAFFRAVSLLAGKHRVEFRYEPLSFMIGAAISLATLCGVSLWTMIVLLADRSKKSVKDFSKAIPVRPTAETFYAFTAAERDKTFRGANDDQP